MDECQEIPEEVGNYLLIRRIGDGSFSSVWEGRHKLANVKVAIKTVSNSLLECDDSRNLFIREIAILKRADHPFITKLFEVIETEDFTFLVMEYVENGTILDWCNKHGRLSEKSARRMFSQILSALEYLHDVRYVCHRDLKAENVLLDRNLNVRLIDFGLSNSFSAEVPELLTACGSPAYAPPEMVRSQPYTKAADMWSAGVLLYAMSVARLPFEGQTMHELVQQITHGEPKIPGHMSRELADLIRKLLTKDPSRRATIEKVKAHPWFSQNEYSELMSLRFSTDKQWRVVGVCREIIEKIAGYGMNAMSLPFAVINDEYNQATAVYYMLRREDITGKIMEVMNDMDKNRKPRNRDAMDLSVAHANKMGPRRHTILPRRQDQVVNTGFKATDADVAGKGECAQMPGVCKKVRKEVGNGRARVSIQIRGMVEANEMAVSAKGLTGRLLRSNGRATLLSKS